MLFPLPGQLGTSPRMQLKHQLLWEALAPCILCWFPKAEGNPFDNVFLPLTDFSLCTQEQHHATRCLPLLRPQASSWGKRDLRAGRGERGCVMLPAPSLFSPNSQGDALGREPKLTWVNCTLLPFRVGNDLVFIHHLDVLVLHLITAGRERMEDSIRVHAAWPCHLSCLGLVGEVAGQAWGTPDSGMFLLVANVCVLGEKDGVVGQCGLTRGQDAPNQVAHHGQDPVVHQQVVHQELHREEGLCSAASRSPSSFPRVTLGKARQCGVSPAMCPACVMTLIFTTTGEGTWH